MAGKKKAPSQRARRLAGAEVSPAVLSPAEERVLKECFDFLRGMPMSEKLETLPAARLREREAVVRAVFPWFCERFPSNSRTEVMNALACAVCLPIQLNTWFTEQSSVILGAACYFLDYADDLTLSQKLQELLPEETDEETDYLLPYAVDVSHTREQLVRMADLLLRRKTTGRKAFRRLLTLLRRDDAARLRNLFRDSVLDYFSRYLEICTRVKPTEQTGVPFSMTPLPNASSLFDKAPEMAKFKDLKDVARQARPDITFLVKAPDLIGAPESRILSELHYRRAAELLKEFTVPDPCALCAALFLLEQEDDLLLSLNALTFGAGCCAVRFLPWSLEEFSEDRPLYESVSADEGLQLRYAFAETDPQTRLFSSPGAEIAGGTLLSEAQLFYLTTGCLLPRNRTQSQSMVRWFQKNGIPRSRARELAEAALVAGCVQDARNRDRVLIPETKEEPEETPEPEEQREADSDRIAELTRQLKSCHAALHEEEQKIRQLQERLRGVERSAEQDRLELSNLRESLFQMKAGEEPEEAAPEEGISFPYQVRSRILVFGGHDTWSKQIRPLLPNVRFFERESLPDLNAVKAADVVWIQPNALSHKFYYRIIDTARKENISVHYFSYASARKCAEQLVMVDRGDG